MEKRRASLRQPAAALIAGALCAAGAGACELPAGTRIESASFALSFRTQPERITPGEHFALEYAVCAKAGATPPGTVGADAWMPEHRHGMNYRASVLALGGGRFRAEGLLLHMPGEWEIVFRAGSERLAHRLRVE